MGQPTPAPAPPADVPAAAGPSGQLLLTLGGGLLLSLAAAHRQRQQLLAALVGRRLRALWRRVDPADPQGSWASLSARAVAELAAAQAEAARGAGEYVATALRTQGARSDPAGMVPASAFAGTAADGRALATLLGYPAFEAAALTDRGMDRAQAVAVGGRHLERIAATEVADAARVSTGVAIVNDRRAKGWTRMLTLPSCSRCVILAGKTYSTAAGAGFARHPLCDCIAVPTAEMVDPPTPRQLFDAMDDAQLSRAGWTKADIAAIRDHDADIYQVTNAHREMHTIQVAGQQLRATRHGTGRGGLAGQRLRAERGGRGGRVVRLTPASIYAEAKRLSWSRDQLVQALKLHGYIL